MSFTQPVAGAAANRKDDKGQLSALTYFTVDWLHWPARCSCRRVQIEPAGRRQSVQSRSTGINWLLVIAQFPIGRPVAADSARY